MRQPNAQQHCAFCHARIQEIDTVKPCPTCESVYHAECWSISGGCVNQACRGSAMVNVDRRLTARPQDLAAVIKPQVVTRPVVHGAAIGSLAGTVLGFLALWIVFGERGTLWYALSIAPLSIALGIFALITIRRDPAFTGTHVAWGGIGLSAISAALLLFPHLPQHGARHDATCFRHCQAALTAILTYAQDHDGALPPNPGSRAWSMALEGPVDAGAFDCPRSRRHGTIQAPEYGFNARMYGVSTGDILYPSDCPLIADVKSPAPGCSIADWNTSLAPRHQRHAAILGYADGHVAFLHVPPGHSALLSMLLSGLHPADGGGAVLFSARGEATLAVPGAADALAVQPFEIDFGQLAGNFIVEAEVSVAELQALRSVSLCVGGVPASGNLPWREGACVGLGSTTTLASATLCATPRGPAPGQSAPGNLRLAPGSWVALFAARINGRYYARITSDRQVLACTDILAEKAVTGARLGMQALSAGAATSVKYRNVRLSTWQ